MGWTFERGQTKEGLIRELLSESSTYAPIAHTCRGNNLWVVIERKPDTPERTEQGYKRPHRLILLYLLENRSEYGWGYKDMDEYSGPYECNCPLAYLDMAPLDHEADIAGYAAAFRDRVRAYHAAAAVKTKARAALRCGDWVELLPGCKPQRVRLNLHLPGRSSWSATDENGTTYRVASKYIAGPVATAIDAGIASAAPKE